jgi:hypothetical protein
MEYSGTMRRLAGRRTAAPWPIGRRSEAILMLGAERAMRP